MKTRNLLRHAILLASAGIALPAHAELPKAPQSIYHIYIGALYGQPDKDRLDTDYGRGFTGSFGMPIRALRNTHLEIGGNTMTLRTPKGVVTNFFRHELNASLVHSFGNRDELTPYILAGVGVARNDTVAVDDTSFTAHIGAGLTRLITDTVRGRIEVKGVYDDFAGTDLFDATLSAGIEVPLGRTRIVEVPVVQPFTPAEPVVQKVEVIKEVIVTPPDSDGDGIADTLDKCPDTLAGVRTDNTGCAIAQTATLANIEFDTNKATLTGASQDVIDTAAKFFSQQPNLRAVIAGHTDDIGKEAPNQKLSQARAETVLKALVAKGLDGKRFKALGLGESMPLVANDSAENRAKNRRVEFLLSTSETN
ncbi:UNVERIFIED_CONTAM: oprF [Trichonephila clavipes]